VLKRDSRATEAVTHEALLLGLRQRLGKVIALSKYGFPFSVGRHPTPICRFRALARRARFAQSGRVRRPLLQLATTFGWPIGAFTSALQARKDARARGRRYGLRQFVDMYWLALRHSIPPIEYELYQFERSERRREAHAYVYWNDVPGLMALNAHLGADTRDVQDKSRFANICAKHGLPHVPTLAVFEGGRQIYPAAPIIPDAPVIWTKALRLSVGAGGAKWTRLGDTYYDGSDRHVSAADMINEFRCQDSIVQPFIENHPDIAGLTNGALASLRIVTGVNQGRDAEFVASSIALPHGICKSSAGGVICSIDRETGRIRNALLNGLPIIRHPDTGASIADVDVPFWRQSLELACRAHAQAFARFAFLGWDFAITTDGPIILETNSGWGALFHQMLDGPIGRTAFARLVQQYV
jgi:Sugar-transfer associated ATP-grasp